jgi:gluconokinase
MGVSGSGRTTVAKGIADAMGWEFAEGEELPRANVEKMASGHPLTDEDREPWLRLGATIKSWSVMETVIWGVGILVYAAGFVV